MDRRAEAPCGTPAPLLDSKRNLISVPEFVRFRGAVCGLASRPTPERHELLRVDLRARLLPGLPIRRCSRAESALDVDQRSLAKLCGDALGTRAPHHDAAPVLSPLLVGSDREACDGSPSPGTARDRARDCQIRTTLLTIVPSVPWMGGRVPVLAVKSASQPSSRDRSHRVSCPLRVPHKPAGHGPP